RSARIALQSAGASMSSNGPTTTIGYVNPEAQVLPGMKFPTWSSWQIDPVEYVEQLQFPRSIQTYDRMRADPQVAALLKGMIQPIMRFHWMIDPNGAPKMIYQPLAEDLGVPVLGQVPVRSKLRPFNHQEHLYTALLALVYGFMYFEMVGTVETNGR